MATVIRGMVGTGDWTGNERPTSYREGILKIFPNGDVPLTAIQSKGRKRVVDDPKFTWFSKDLDTQSGTCTVWHDQALSDDWAVGESGSVGDVIYCKMAAAVVASFRPGHTALLLDADDNSKRSFGKVGAVVTNGASSYVAVTLLVSSSAGYLNAVDTIDIIGNSNAEGAPIPAAIAYVPDEFFNRTQIWRTPMSITRTQKKTRMRTGDQYKELKRDVLLYHGVEMENAAIWSEKAEFTGANGEKERTTQGMVSFIAEKASDNVINYSLGTGLTWLQGGEDWLDESLEQLFRFGAAEKIALSGSGALLGIQKLVKQSGQFTLTVESMGYGIGVTRWHTPFGDILLVRHPLFSYKAHSRNNMLIYEPKNVQFAYIDDTHFKGDPAMQEAGFAGYDGTKEEFLTEGGYEFHFPNTFMFLSGVGVNGVA